MIDQKDQLKAINPFSPTYIPHENRLKAAALQRAADSKTVKAWTLTGAGAMSAGVGLAVIPFAAPFVAGGLILISGVALASGMKFHEIAERHDTRAKQLLGFAS